MNALISRAEDRLVAGAIALLICPSVLSADSTAGATKPVLLYSRYFNAVGEERYLPNGTYSDVVQRLRLEFEVRVHDQPLNSKTLASVRAVFIANPSDRAVGTNPPPHHFSTMDIEVINGFVRRGGG